MKKRILTGDRPTGPLHLGHYVGSLANRVKLQDEYECFFIIADYQVLTDHLKETSQIEKNIKEIVLDYLSVGIDPKKSTIFIQSKIPAIAELTMYFSMMVSLAEVERNPTVKTEIKTAREEGKISEISYGFVGYPISQAADILFLRAHLVPVGKDQLPHIDLTREIARKFNKLFGKVFPIPKALVGEIPSLPGLDGRKMSKSLGNAIYLSDPSQEVKNKVIK
jgi:tryptophanyl-tRNA synthetase